MTTASVMTYDSLVLNIQQYLERTDAQTIAQIPNFIMLAEQVIASQIKFLGNLTVAESTMTTGNPVLDKPYGRAIFLALWMMIGVGMLQITRWRRK